MAKIMGKVKSVGWDAIKAGGISGVTIGVLSNMIGPLPGHIIGGIGVGAMLGGTAGEIVAINAVQDAVVLAMTQRAA